MFKFQDLLYAKRVGATWAPNFVLFLQSHASLVSKMKEFEKESPAQGMLVDTGEMVESVSWKDYYLYRLEEMCKVMLKTFDNNRSWQKGMLKKHKKMGIPEMPVQYNIDKYFQQDFSDNAEDFIAQYKDGMLHVVEEIFTKAGTSSKIPRPNTDNYKVVEGIVDTLRKEMVEILNKNQLYFAKPSYDNLWLYCGEIDDDEAPNTFQGLHVITYTPEQWDKVYFSRDYLRENKFVLDEDEFVVSIDHYAMLKDIEGIQDNSYFKDGHSYVHFDKDHKPIDVLTFMPDDDVMYDWLGAFGKFRTELLPDDLLEAILEREEAEGYVESNDEFYRLMRQCYIEVGYLFIRTYLVLELFTIINTKNSSLPKGEKVLVERPTGAFVNTKRTRKKLKSKLDIDVDEEFLVMKELVINPLMTTETDSNNVYLPTDGLTKLREHSRAGHYKTYLPEKPRFGVYHKNNIGTYWFPPTDVAKGSKKGKVDKVYKVEK